MATARPPVVAHLERDAVGLGEAGELRRDRVLVALAVAEERRRAEEPHRHLRARRLRLVARAHAVDEVGVGRRLVVEPVAEERIDHAGDVVLLRQRLGRPRAVAQRGLVGRVEGVVGNRRGAVRLAADLVVDPARTEVGEQDQRHDTDHGGDAQHRPARARASHPPVRTGCARRRTGASATSVRCARARTTTRRVARRARARRSGTAT